MDFIAIAHLAMKLLGNKDLLDKVKNIVPPEPPSQPKSQYRPGSVEWLQDALNEINGADLEVDGDYGEATREAVRQYQGEHSDLEPDGWAGPLTVAALMIDLQRDSTKVNDRA